MENAPTLPPVEHEPKDKESRSDKKAKAKDVSSFSIRLQSVEQPKPETEKKPVSEHHKNSAESKESKPDEERYAVKTVAEHNKDAETARTITDRDEQYASKKVIAYHNALIEADGDFTEADAKYAESFGIEPEELKIDEPIPDFAESDEADELEDLPDIDIEAEPLLDDDDEDEAESTALPEAEPVDTSVPSATAPPLPPTPPGGGHGAGHGGGGGGTPPLVPPAGGGMPPHGPGGAPPILVPHGPGGHVNLAPTAAAAPAERVVVQQANNAGALLVGGIVGYLIGRRRGRIKTERRLLPVQKKLKKEVKALQWQVQAKEDKIRKIAFEQSRARRMQPREKVHPQAEKIIVEAPQIVTKSAIERQPAITRLERPLVTAPVAEIDSKETTVLATAAVPALEKLADKISREPAPEAKKLHIVQHEAPSKIGRMLVTAEANTRTKIVEKAPQPITVEKSIQALNRHELLRMSEQIVVDGSSLRQIYETKLVSEKGLRRLVQEHLRGGDLKKALRREIVEREIDFERDPAMRDSPGQSNSNGGSSVTNLQQLLKQADATADTDSEEVAFLKARAVHEAREQAAAKNKRKLIDVSLITTIVILGFVIFIVLMSH